MFHSEHQVLILFLKSKQWLQFLACEHHTYFLNTSFPITEKTTTQKGKKVTGHDLCTGERLWSWRVPMLFVMSTESSSPENELLTEWRGRREGNGMSRKGKGMSASGSVDRKSSSNITETNNSVALVAYQTNNSVALVAYQTECRFSSLSNKVSL